MIASERQGQSLLPSHHSVKYVISTGLPKGLLRHLELIVATRRGGLGWSGRIPRANQIAHLSKAGVVENVAAIVVTVRIGMGRAHTHADLAALPHPVAVFLIGAQQCPGHSIGQIIVMTDLVHDFINTAAWRYVTLEIAKLIDQAITVEQVHPVGREQEQHTLENVGFVSMLLFTGLVAELHVDDPDIMLAELGASEALAHVVAHDVGALVPVKSP